MKPATADHQCRGTRLAPLFCHYGMLHPDVAVHLETVEQAPNIVETGTT
ncbi:MULTISPECIES: hypothetical protein [Sphingobium]|nr:hypothetical protein [Sphingobium sp. MI1205]